MKREFTRVIVLGGLLPLAPILTPSAVADEVVQLEEVIVTANRREENLQEVAISVSAFTDEFFKNTGTTNLKQLDQYTPNFKITPVTDSRSTSIRIRGIGSVGSNAGIDPSVGVFIDGVYQGRAGMSVADLMDIQRVEVLRGPQGTLYGKNTAAGALNIISKAPAELFEAEVELVLGNYETVEARGMVNVPLGDSGHATRLSGYYVENGGFDKNTYTGKDINITERWGLRSRTLFSTENAGDFTFSLDYSKNTGDCCAPDIIDYVGDGSAQGLPFERLVAETGVPLPDVVDPYDRELYFDTEFTNDVKVGGVALEWSKELNNEYVLTWINAYRGYESFSTLDGDFSHYAGVKYETDVELSQVSSEFRIASPVGEVFDWQIGFYYFDSQMDTEGQNGFLPLFGSNFANPPFPDGIWPDGGINFDTNKHETTSYATFGQANWTFAEDWKLTFGARYTYEEKSRKGTQISTPDPIFPIDAPPIAGPDTAIDEDRDADDISPSLSLSYFAAPDVMLYASASQGFKSGGFNQLRTAQGVPGEFDDERSRNYELGIKSSWLERRLQVNMTAFFVDYEDFQAQGFDGSNILVRNAGTMESKGVEFDLIYVPNSLATMGMAIGYNDATYGEFPTGECTAAQLFAVTGGSPLVPADCVQDLEGKSIDNAPEWTVSNFLQLSDDFGDSGMSWMARLEYNYTGELYMAQDLDESVKRDPVHMVNARVNLSGANKKWEVTLWGRNLLDEEYHVVAFDIPVTGGFAGINAPPLTYGLTLNYRTQ
ncbi:TonB-dependent receptor [Halieaceae bacterium IMCC14734]|uniref:TonB-dependent receptor n=1 Tax=Candidatus Litorirhabdus singularis TaxID=2518993 RepID=A0ABT3TFT8_9GAMM|nr:TonB-dependent receptor [Candidatus Litorirhabdus singularis]MCX2980282.1 TonB-dependent receptor [Candidatus Litorirhabdus singularis]